MVNSVLSLNNLVTGGRKNSRKTSRRKASRKASRRSRKGKKRTSKAKTSRRISKKGRAKKGRSKKKSSKKRSKSSKNVYRGGSDDDDKKKDALHRAQDPITRAPDPIHKNIANLYDLIISLKHNLNKDVLILEKNPQDSSRDKPYDNNIKAKILKETIKKLLTNNDVNNLQLIKNTQEALVPQDKNDLMARNYAKLFDKLLLPSNNFDTLPLSLDKIKTLFLIIARARRMNSRGPNPMYKYIFVVGRELNGGADWDLDWDPDAEGANDKWLAFLLIQAIIYEIHYERDRFLRHFKKFVTNLRWVIDNQEDPPGDLYSINHPKYPNTLHYTYKHLYEHSSNRYDYVTDYQSILDWVINILELREKDKCPLLSLQFKEFQLSLSPNDDKLKLEKILKIYSYVKNAQAPDFFNDRQAGPGYKDEQHDKLIVMDDWNKDWGAMVGDNCGAFILIQAIIREIYTERCRILTHFKNFVKDPLGIYDPDDVIDNLSDLYNLNDHFTPSTLSHTYIILAGDNESLATDFQTLLVWVMDMLESWEKDKCPRGDWLQFKDLKFINN